MTIEQVSAVDTSEGTVSEEALELAVIIAVVAYKGGIGKTTIAMELAYLLQAVLFDLDWDRGGASRAWGHRHETRKTAPLLDAIESGRTPRPMRAPYRADLVPCHPDFVDNQPDPDRLAVLLEKWVGELQRPGVADTHPGGVPSSFGAASAAHLVLVPTLLEEKPLEALEGQLEELRDYRMLIVPNKVPKSPPERLLKRLSELSKRYGVPVAPPISEYVWLPRRSRRMAVCSANPPSKRAEDFVAEMKNLARVVRKHVGAA